jgi:hypothetical protein
MPPNIYLIPCNGWSLLIIFLILVLLIIFGTWLDRNDDEENFK